MRHGMLHTALYANIYVEVCETSWIVAHLRVREDHEDSREPPEWSQTTLVKEADDDEAFDKDDEDEYISKL